MAQTDAGRSPPSPPCLIPNSSLTRCPWERTGTLRQWPVGCAKKSCPARARTKTSKGARHALLCPLFLDRLSLLSELDSRFRRRPSSRDPRFFGHLIILDQSCHPQGLNPELSTHSCSNSARKHTPQNLTPNSLATSTSRQQNTMGGEDGGAAPAEALAPPPSQAPAPAPVDQHRPADLALNRNEKMVAALASPMSHTETIPSLRRASTDSSLFSLTPVRGRPPPSGCHRHPPQPANTSSSERT